MQIKRKEEKVTIHRWLGPTIFLLALCQCFGSAQKKFRSGFANKKCRYGSRLIYEQISSTHCMLNLSIFSTFYLRKKNLKKQMPNQHMEVLQNFKKPTNLLAFKITFCCQLSFFESGQELCGSGSETLLLIIVRLPVMDILVMNSQLCQRIFFDFVFQTRRER